MLNWLKSNKIVLFLLLALLALTIYRITHFRSVLQGAPPSDHVIAPSDDAPEDSTDEVYELDGEEEDAEEE